MRNHFTLQFILLDSWRSYSVPISHQTELAKNIYWPCWLSSAGEMARTADKAFFIL